MIYGQLSTIVGCEDVDQVDCGSREADKLCAFRPFVQSPAGLIARTHSFALQTRLPISNLHQSLIVFQRLGFEPGFTR